MLAAITTMASVATAERCAGSQKRKAVLANDCNVDADFRTEWHWCRHSLMAVAKANLSIAPLYVKDPQGVLARSWFMASLLISFTLHNRC